MGVLSLHKSLKDAKVVEINLEDFQVKFKNPNYRAELFDIIKNENVEIINQFSKTKESVGNDLKEFNLNYYSTESDSPFDNDDGTIMAGDIYEGSLTTKPYKINDDFYKASATVYNFSSALTVDNNISSSVETGENSATVTIGDPVGKDTSEGYNLLKDLITINKDGGKEINKKLFNLQPEELVNSLSIKFPGLTFEKVSSWQPNAKKIWENSAGSKWAAAENRPGTATNNYQNKTRRSTTSNAVKVTAKDGSYTVIQADIAGSVIGTYGTNPDKKNPSYLNDLSKNDQATLAYTQSYNDLATFVSNHIEDVDLVKIYEQNIDFAKTLGEYDKLITPDVNKIKEKFSGKDLFTPTEPGWYKSIVLNAYVSDYSKRTDAEKETAQPYEEELKMMRERYYKKNGKMPSEGMLHAITREYLIDEETFKLPAYNEYQAYQRGLQKALTKLYNLLP